MLLVSGTGFLHAQGLQPGDDTTRLVQILSARKLELLKPDDSTNIQVLVGAVKLKQGSTIFECDSCIINKRINLMEAFGHVHINDADTANVYSDYMKYIIDKQVAYFKRNVRLTDGKGTLTTNDLEYDVATKLGIYKNGGKVVNKKTTLTSEEGWYYPDLKDIYFKKKVLLKDPGTTLRADSLLYNTGTEKVIFISETEIKDSSGRVVKTKTGYYDTKNQQAEFGGRAEIKDGKTTVIADKIITDDKKGISQAIGNAVVVDSAQGTTIIGGIIIRNNNTESFLATGKPLMIVKQDEDSIYITADTLFSARLTDMYRSKDALQKDTIKGIKVVDTKTKDSTNRYFEGFHNVKIFSDSVQAISDSIFYSFKDSVFRLFQKPVVWSRGSQVMGDTILLFTKNKKADRFKVFENSFLVNRVQDEVFNQIKSSRMDGYLTDGSLDSVRARGFAQCIYYIQDEDSAFTGVNESSSDIMDVYFAKQELKRVVFRSAVKGTLWPMRSKSPAEMRLQRFEWLEDRRPKTKYDLY